MADRVHDELELMPPASTTANGNAARANGHQQRVPPHNLQAEESLLSALMQSREARDQALGMLRAEDFYRPAYGHIYATIEKLHEHDQPADPVTIADELGRSGLLDEIDVQDPITGLHHTGRHGLITLQTTVPASSGAAHYAKIVLDHALLREVITFGGEVTADAYSLPDDITGIRARTERLLELLDRSATNRAARSFGDVITSWIADMNRRAVGDRSALKTGFIDLDAILGGGLHPGQLVVVAGRTSMGKTAFAGSLALNIAAAGKPVLMSSIEMAELELADRWVSSTAKVDLGTIRNASLNLEDWSRVDRATATLSTQPIWVDDHDDITISYLRGLARSLPQPPAVIIVDYLQLLRPSRRFDNRQEAVADISSSLKKLARRLQVPIVALAQLNRSAESRSDKRPMLSDLRESGSIENDADVVIGLYREKYYKRALDEDILEAIVMKQRSGPLQTVNLHFAAEIAAVLNLAQREDF